MFENVNGEGNGAVAAAAEAEPAKDPSNKNNLSMTDQEIIWEYFVHPEEQEEEQLQEKWFQNVNSLVDASLQMS